MRHKVTLTIAKSQFADRLSDVVRIHESDRGQLTKRRVCKITTGKYSTFAFLLGADDDDRGKLIVDLALREKLNLPVNGKFDFTIEQGLACRDWLCWALNASNPANRIAAWLGLISLILGLLSIAISLMPLL